MDTKVKILILLLILINGVNVFAQKVPTREEKRKSDSIVRIYYREAAVRNPILRQVVVSTEIIGNSNIKSNLNGDDLFEGKVSQTKTNVLLTLPLVAWGKNSVTGTFLFENNEYRLSKLELFQPQYKDQLYSSTISRNSVGANLGYQRIDSLFGKNVVYAANINAVSGKRGTIQRVNFLGTAIINFKQTKTTSFSAGLVLNIDPTINLPVFPVVTYWHKFQNGLEVNVNLPQQLMLRKDFGKQLSVNLGTSMAISSSFFDYPDQTVIPENSNYTVLALQNGIGLEYRLAGKIMIGLNGGIQTPLSARAFEVNKNSSDYFIKNKIGASPYLKLSVSLLPVFRSIF